MSIIDVGIDGRLIHRQVASLWVAKSNASRIMIVDDETAGSAIEKSGLKLAIPTGMKLSMLPVEKAAQDILVGKYDSQRLLVVVRKPNCLLKLVELGVPIKEINIGNVS